MSVSPSSAARGGRRHRPSTGMIRRRRGRRSSGARRSPACVRAHRARPKGRRASSRSDAIESQRFEHGYAPPCRRWRSSQARRRAASPQLALRPRGADAAASSSTPTRAQVYRRSPRPQRPPLGGGGGARRTSGCTAMSTAADACSAADWAAMARRACIADAQATGRLPILVGGSRPLHPHAARRHRAGARQIDRRTCVPPCAPCRWLTRSARPVAHRPGGTTARLNPADATRIARALEVARSTATLARRLARHRAASVGSAMTFGSPPKPILLPIEREWLLRALRLPLRQRCWMRARSPRWRRLAYAPSSRRSAR
jgi:hypothetical protein